MNKNKKERIFYFDLLRAIAIASVIMCHSWALNPFLPLGGENFHFFPLDTLGYVGVPLFFMLSGALLFNKDYNLSTYLRKRFSRIVYPFIFWIFLFLMFGISIFNFSYGKVYSILIGDSFVWFVWALVGLYLFVPVFNSFLKEFDFKGLNYFLAIWVVTIILNSIGLYPFFNLELSYFAGNFGFMAIGYYLVNKNFKFSIKGIIIFSLIIFLLSVSFHSLARIMGIEVLVSVGYTNIFPVLESVSLFIFIRFISEYVNDYDSILSNFFKNLKDSILTKSIYSISICSYAMYFIHIIVINFFIAFTDMEISFIFCCHIRIIMDNSNNLD